VAALQLRRGAARRSAALTRRRRSRDVAAIIDGADASLLDLVDHVLTKGVVVSGDVVLSLADVDLVYLRLSALLCAADRVLGTPARRRRRGRR
jgi:hypothetical protein